MTTHILLLLSSPLQLRTQLPPTQLPRRLTHRRQRLRLLDLLRFLLLGNLDRLGWPSSRLSLDCCFLSLPPGDDSSMSLDGLVLLSLRDDLVGFAGRERNAVLPELNELGSEETFDES